MSLAIERLAAIKGTFYVGDLVAHNGLSHEVIQILADGTIISVLSGTDSKGVATDLKVALGIGSGPAFAKGLVLAVPNGYQINQIQLSAGAVNIS